MIEKVAGFSEKMKMSKTQAREMARTLVPKLKRWQSKYKECTTPKNFVISRHVFFRLKLLKIESVRLNFESCLLDDIFDELGMRSYNTLFKNPLRKTDYGRRRVSRDTI